VQNLAFGARAAVPSSRRRRRRHRLCTARAEMAAQLGTSVAFAVLGAQLGSSVALCSGCGQALPGVPRRAPLSSWETLGATVDSSKLTEHLPISHMKKHAANADNTA